MNERKHSGAGGYGADCDPDRDRGLVGRIRWLLLDDPLGWIKAALAIAVIFVLLNLLGVATIR